MERGQRTFRIVLELLTEILTGQHLQRVCTWGATGENIGGQEIVRLSRPDTLDPYGRGAGSHDKGEDNKRIYSYFSDCLYRNYGHSHHEKIGAATAVSGQHSRPVPVPDDRTHVLTAPVRAPALRWARRQSRSARSTSCGMLPSRVEAG